MTRSTDRSPSPALSRSLALCLALSLALSLGACDADSSSAGADAGAAADTAEADAPGASDAGADTGAAADTGTVHVTGHYTGTLAGTPNLRVSMFTCPFQMPPKYFFEGTYDAATGDVDATQDGVEPGAWCLMAYIDVNPDDGLAPVTGLDPVNAGNGENMSGALPVTVTAGQTTEVALSFGLVATSTQ